MAVLSTIHLYRPIVDFSQYVEDMTAFGIQVPQLQFDCNGNTVLQHEHHIHNEHELMDDDDVWYCSYCGDGPYSKWQPACQNCSRAK